MKTKLQFLVSIASLVAFTQVNAQVLTSNNDMNNLVNKVSSVPVINSIEPAISSDNSNDGINATTNVSVADNTNITDNAQSLLATDSYHHGGGGGGDGAVDGKNIVYAGVGFVSILGALASVLSFGASVSGAATVTSIPCIDLAYERGLSEHWGVGLRLTYQSVTVSTTGSIDNSFAQYTNPPYTIYSYTDKLTLTGIAAVATGSYHFHASDKVDPYIGLAVGYTSIGFSFTNNDPNAGIGPGQDGNVSTPIFNFGGFTFGGFGGLRVYFTNNIGAWLDIGYIGVGSAVFNFGIAAKF